MNYTIKALIATGIILTSSVLVFACAKKDTGAVLLPIVHTESVVVEPEALFNEQDTEDEKLPVEAVSMDHTDEYEQFSVLELNNEQNVEIRSTFKKISKKVSKKATHTYHKKG